MAVPDTTSAIASQSRVKNDAWEVYDVSNVAQVFMVKRWLPAASLRLQTKERRIVRHRELELQLPRSVDDCGRPGRIHREVGERQ